jgi:hypothetical protein
MTNHRFHNHPATSSARAACRKARANECQACRGWAEETALDNYIDHIGIRVQGQSYTMSRDLTPTEEAEVAEWADSLLAAEALELRIHDDH